MIVCSGQHFSTLYLELLQTLLGANVEIRISRGGPVRDFRAAACELAPGGNRFCILRHRRFNPFFSLAEVSWVLAGSKLLAPLEFHLSRFREFSDDGQELYGAYGFRLRHAFGQDQLHEAVEALKTDPTTRRVVLSLWNVADRPSVSKDIPCNTTVFLKIRDDRLDVMVCSRSNDAFLGVPYDVVTFAALQSWLASEIGVRPGWQTHVTDSLHLYERDHERVKKVVDGNRRDEIEQVLALVPEADLAFYCGLDHEDLTRRFADEVEGEGACLAVRNSFIRWRQGLHRLAIGSVPASDIGLAALGWFSSSNRFEGGFMPAWGKWLLPDADHGR